MADHFQYQASLGLIALFAVAANRTRRKLGPGLQRAALPAAGVLLLALGALTWRQSGNYESEERTWTHTLEKNPACLMAHNNLGLVLAAEGKATAEHRGHARAMARGYEDLL